MKPDLPLEFRAATADDLPRLQAIREAAFAPIFSSFRAMLGDALYERVQAGDDAAQGDLLRSMMDADSGWAMTVVQRGDQTVGFVGIRGDSVTSVGEIGLNAVDPAHAGMGIGTAMYCHAIELLREMGMRAAVVGTGGDPSHAPAREAYRKAGFGHSVPSVWMSRLL